MEALFNNEIFSFLWLYRDIIIFVVGSMALVIAVIVWWDKVKYFFMNMKYGFPVIGKIAKARRSSEKQKENGWFPCEETLCSDFASYYVKHNKSVDYYNKCRNYLNKCQETGRRKKGFLLNTLLIFLILFEAVGFSYVFAPFMVQNGSANTASMLAWFCAFLLSIIAVCLTDKTGEEIHHNSLIKKMRTWFENDRNEQKDLSKDSKVDLENTYIDDNAKSYVQMVNRVPTNDTVTPSYSFTFGTIIYILIIAIGAFMVRSYTLESIEAEAVNTASPFTSSSFPSSSSPFELPAEAEVFNQSADKKAGDDKKSAVHMASLTTYIILSVIFVAIQVLGIMFGYLYSLSGRESAKAWKYTKDFNNSEEFANYYQRQLDQIAHDAQAKLSALQESLSSRVTTSGYEREAMLRGGQKTFDIYLQNKEKERKAKLAQEAELNQSETSRQQVDDHSVETEHADNELHEDQVRQPEATNSAHLETSSVINNIGDISNFDDQDLAMLAKELGVELEQLQRKKRVQLKLIAVRQTVV
jgi:hypothetical protein